MSRYRVLAAAIALLAVTLIVQGLTDSPVAAGAAAIAFFVLAAIAYHYHYAGAVE